jgi:hypothetical protein
MWVVCSPTFLCHTHDRLGTCLARGEASVTAPTSQPQSRRLGLEPHTGVRGKTSERHKHGLRGRASCGATQPSRYENMRRASPVGIGFVRLVTKRPTLACASKFLVGSKASSRCSRCFCRCFRCFLVPSNATLSAPPRHPVSVVPFSRRLQRTALSWGHATSPLV